MVGVLFSPKIFGSWFHKIDSDDPFFSVLHVVVVAVVTTPLPPSSSYFSLINFCFMLLVDVDRD